MKLGQIKSIWIVASLFATTAYTCIRMIYGYYSYSKLSRDKVNNILQDWINSLLSKARVHCTVYNPHDTQPQAGRAIILMCNHSSAFDIPIAFKAFPTHSIRMLSKKELSKFPLLGKAMTAGEFPFIDRKNRYQALKDLEYAKQLMESGIILWIAPEGTRSTSGKLAPFKKGGFITAIQSQAIIIPIGIRGASDILAADSLRVNLDQNAEIHIGKAIDTSEYTLDNKELLLERTYAAIKELVGE